MPCCLTFFELWSKSSDTGLQGLCSSKLPVWAHPDGCFARGGACIDREASGEDRDSTGPRLERQTLHGMVCARFVWSARLRACWNLGAFLEFKQGSFCCLSLSFCCGLVWSCMHVSGLGPTKVCAEKELLFLQPESVEISRPERLRISELSSALHQFPGLIKSPRGIESDDEKLQDSKLKNQGPRGNAWKRHYGNWRRETREQELQAGCNRKSNIFHLCQHKWLLNDHTMLTQRFQSAKRLLHSGRFSLRTHRQFKVEKVIYYKRQRATTRHSRLLEETSFADRCCQF